MDTRDNPKDTDFLWWDYVEWIESNWKFPWKELVVYDQYDNADTQKWCSAYWLTYIYNWNQLIEYRKQWIDWEQEDPRWKRLTFQAERWYPNQWASLQDMMSFFKKRWLIDWYLRCESYEQCRNAINNWFGIYTGSNKCSWWATSKNYEFTEWDWGAHCFSIVDCDDKWFIAINSFGKDWWKWWYFHINYDKYWLLYSTYAIADHDDSWKIDEMMYNLEYNKAIELWLTNWTRPDDPVSRRECSVIALRVYKKILELNK